MMFRPVDVFLPIIESEEMEADLKYCSSSPGYFSIRKRQITENPACLCSVHELV
jgi:hypothetical protein